MRKMILGCLGVVAMIAMQFAQAEVKAGVFSDCDPCAEAGCDPCDPCGEDSIFCDPCADIDCNKKSKWVWGGLIEGGVYVNEYGNTDYRDPGGTGGWPYLANSPYERGNGLVPGNGSTGSLTTARTDATINQAYFFFGKELSKKGWDFGGRASVMFGTDAWIVQSEGLEYGAGHNAGWRSGDYYTALAEAYFEVGYNKLSVKIGKFFSPIGSESIVANERFFYSTSDAFAITPNTHSGALATWTPNKKLSIFGGWVNGYDRFFDDSDDNAFLGGFKYQFNKKLYLSYAAMVGTRTWGELSQGVTEDTDYFFQSFVVGFKPNKRWDYTFEWVLSNERDVSRENDKIVGKSSVCYGYYGINQELIYKLNKKWAIGGRFEWSHDIDWPDEEKYSFTLGANWQPTKRLTVRPEVRYDKYDGWDYFTDKGGVDHADQISGGVSAYFAF